MRRGLPKARQGLLTTDHSRRGRRCVTVLDPDTLSVAVLEPWEHAVLVLCDGRRGTYQISKLIGEVEGVAADEAAVKSAIEFFVKSDLVELTQSSSAPRFASARPKSIAALQAAYEEWHKDPVRTSQILSARVASPFETDPLKPKAPAPELEPLAAFDDAPTRHAQPVVRSVDLKKRALRGATEPSGRPAGLEDEGLTAAPGASSLRDSGPAAPRPAVSGLRPEEPGFFGDEPTLTREAGPRAKTELSPAAPPARPLRRKPPPRRVAKSRDKTQRIDSSAEEERLVQETLRMGEALPRGRCPVCLAEVPENARICPACRTRL